jgi:MFS family permease
MGHGRAVWVALIGYAVSMAAMAVLNGRALLGCGLLFGVAHGLFFPAAIAFAIAFRGGRRDKAVASVNTWFSIGALLVPLEGAIADRSGYRAIFLGAAALTLLAALLTRRAAGPPVPGLP